MLTLEEQLDQTIYDEGILSGEGYFEEARGLYRSYSDGTEVILINSQIESRAERCVVKGHELGHHFTGTEGDLTKADKITVSREEYRANRWALERLIPIDKLIKAFRSGFNGLVDLADMLDLSLDYLSNGIDMYCSMHGPVTHHGQYIITWNPFRIKKDKRRKKK